MLTDCISYQNSGIPADEWLFRSKKQFTLFITASPQENFEGQILENKLITMIRIESFSFGTTQYAPIETSHLTTKYWSIKSNQYIYRYYGTSIELFTGPFPYIKSFHY
jgi:hypothetical protein